MACPPLDGPQAGSEVANMAFISGAGGAGVESLQAGAACGGYGAAVLCGQVHQGVSVKPAGWPAPNSGRRPCRNILQLLLATKLPAFTSTPCLSVPTRCCHGAPAAPCREHPLERDGCAERAAVHQPYGGSRACPPAPPPNCSGCKGGWLRERRCSTPAPAHLPAHVPRPHALGALLAASARPSPC